MELDKFPGTALKYFCVPFSIILNAATITGTVFVFNKNIVI